MQHVLVVENGSLLDEGVERLLSHETDFLVSGITYADETAFLQDVSDKRPDVILLNEAGPLDSVQIFELLKNLPTIATLRVIIVRPDDNAIDVYDRQRVIATQSRDLIGLVRNAGNRVRERTSTPKLWARLWPVKQEAPE